MWKRAVAVAAVALAIVATTTLPTFAEQGKGRRTVSVAKSNRPQPAKQARSARAAQPRPSKAKPAKATPARGAKAKAAKRADDLNRDPSQMTAEQRQRLRNMLPAGMTIEQAAAGFDNHGQFIAAVNASRTHRVSFVQLKHLMVNQRMTLGQALKSLRPDLGDLDDNGNVRVRR